MNWEISSFIKNLSRDSEVRNFVRKVKNANYSIVKPSISAKSKLLHYSDDVLKNLKIPLPELNLKEFNDLFSGRNLSSEIQPFSMNYGGHQFGQWAGQLGDGRAINLGTLNNLEIQLKGAGKTPYSRHADGRAVLRSSIREYLISEAMHHLGIPTTRAFTLMELEEKIERDMLYNGQPKMEKSAVISRVAPTFIRFGNFEIHAANQEFELLKILADYVIEFFYPAINIASTDKYILFFKEVLERTLDTLIHWQRVGFTHGVLNTDNMSILGLTIDYGPFGFLDEYDPGFTPNTTDFANKRYRFENQPPIAQWNLLQLANALFPLVKESKPFEELLNAFPQNYRQKYIEMMKAKIGLIEDHSDDFQLIQELEGNLQLVSTDYTLFFRGIGDVETTQDFIEILKNSTYKPLSAIQLQKWKDWFQKYTFRLNIENLSFNDRRSRMNALNPKYILRNYMLWQATENAEKDDYELIDEFFKLVKQPYNEQEDMEKWIKRKPDWADQQIGSRYLSCSS